MKLFFTALILVAANAAATAAVNDGAAADALRGPSLVDADLVLVYVATDADDVDVDASYHYHQNDVIANANLMTHSADEVSAHFLELLLSSTYDGIIIMPHILLSVFLFPSQIENDVPKPNFLRGIQLHEEVCYEEGRCDLHEDQTEEALWDCQEFHPDSGYTRGYCEDDKLYCCK